MRRWLRDWPWCEAILGAAERFGVVDSLLSCLPDRVLSIWGVVMYSVLYDKMVVEIWCECPGKGSTGEPQGTVASHMLYVSTWRNRKQALS